MKIFFYVQVRGKKFIGFLSFIGVDFNEIKSLKNETKFLNFEYFRLTLFVLQK